MKKTASISILISLLALYFLFAGLAAAYAQQPVTEERKRAMHKLDPIDIFPQVQERGGRERGRDKKTSNDVASAPADESDKTAKNGNSRRNSRRRNSSSETLATDLANNPGSLPTPAAIANNNASAEIAATPEPQTALAANPNSPILAGENNNVNVRSSQTMVALNTSPIPINDASKNHTLSLPIILALLVMVLVMLILVFTKLIRYLRGPVA